MAVPTWLLGPAGDLRPLPAPDMNIDNSISRFGGIHTAINGARTVDVLGHRANYEFDLPFLEPDEYHWLEALFTETIPGPFYLIDPLRKNLLSRESATARPADSSGRGVTPFYSGGLSWSQVNDSPVSWLKRGLTWTGLTNNAAGAAVVLDGYSFIPAPSEGQVTLSVYAKPNEDISLHWYPRFFDSGFNPIPLADISPLVELTADEWTRIDQAFSMPSTDVTTLLPELWYESGGTATSSTSVQLIGFQAEYGSAATDVSLGGGSMRAVIEDMSTTSPYYPYQSVILSLLEV